MPPQMMLQCILFLMPWPIRRAALKALFGWKISKSAKVGFSLIRSAEVNLGDGAVVGHLNFVRNLEKFDLRKNAIVGNYNLITGSYKTGLYPHCNPKSSFFMDEGAAITHEHRIDCSDTVSIGAYTTIAGRATQIWTHGIDVATATQKTDPVYINDRVLMGSRCLVLKGAEIGRCTVIAAGSVVHGKIDPECIVGGVPARVIRRLKGSEAYFVRSCPRID